MKKINIIRFIAASIILVSVSSVAGIVIDNTRIIFQAAGDSAGKSIGITSTTNSLIPYLVKAQILKTIKGDDADTPFLVTPSLFRLEPGATNQVRIMKKPINLPHDRESVFYFRTIAVPSGEKNDSTQESNIGGMLQVSTGNIIKLFYRPANLGMTQQQAMRSLQFSSDRNGLKITNPSPYYISLDALKIGDTKIAMSIKNGNTMIAPFSSNTFSDVLHKGRAEWKAINDYGATEVFYGFVR